jgi:hypothetical protein
MRTLPPLAILLGVAGLLPFVAGSLGAVSPDSELARLSLLAVSGYGAVILSFLGGVHWGLALSAGTSQTQRVQRARFGLGVVPALIGWAGLLVTFIGLPKTGLLVLVAGFIALTIGEARATRVGLLPAGYMGLRWVLSLVVIVCLVSVCLVLALGGKIIL